MDYTGPPPTQDRLEWLWRDGDANYRAAAAAAEAEAGLRLLLHVDEHVVHVPDDDGGDAHVDRERAAGRGHRATRTLNTAMAAATSLGRN
jgi:hypothetical protein